MTYVAARLRAPSTLRSITRTALSLLLAACFLIQGRAEAGFHGPKGSNPTAPGKNGPGRHSNAGFGAPEIDASLAAGGIILLVGGMLILTHSRKSHRA